MKELFIDRKLLKHCEFAENPKMKGYSLKNIKQLIYDPIKDSFLTPLLVGII